MITTSLLPPSTLNASSLSFDTIKSELVASELIVTFELAPGFIVTAVGMLANKLDTDIFLLIGVPDGSSITCSKSAAAMFPEPRSVKAVIFLSAILVSYKPHMY